MKDTSGFIQRADRLRELDERITAASYARRYIENERERAEIAQGIARDKYERRILLGV